MIIARLPEWAGGRLLHCVRGTVHKEWWMRPLACPMNADHTKSSSLPFPQYDPPISIDSPTSLKCFLCSLDSLKHSLLLCSCVCCLLLVCVCYELVRGGRVSVCVRTASYSSSCFRMLAQAFSSFFFVYCLKYFSSVFCMRLCAC